MAQARGKKRVEPSDEKEASSRIEATGENEAGTLSPIPELMRRAIAMGLSGFFTTEEAVRRAFGDTVPKDWTDFLLDTSDRTRSEFLDRVSREIGRVLEGVDVASVFSQLLEGRTLQINAQFRLTEKGTAGKTEVQFKDADKETGG